MNNKTMGKEIANPIQREQFIKDNADACENKGYMKAYNPEELQGHKEKTCECFHCDFRNRKRD